MTLVEIVNKHLDILFKETENKDDAKTYLDEVVADVFDEIPLESLKKIHEIVIQEFEKR